MKFIWKNSQSNDRPEDVDYTSSPTTVYLHRNIKKVDEHYEYEVCKLSPEDFRTYISASLKDVPSGMDDFGNVVSNMVEGSNDIGEMIAVLDERISTLEAK